MLTPHDKSMQADAPEEVTSRARVALRRASEWADSRADELQGFSGGMLIAELIRGWRTLCSVLGISVAAALLFVAFAQKTYTAYVLVEPSMLSIQEGNSLAGGGLELLKGLSGADLNSTVTPYMRFISELDAHSVATKMQQQFSVLQVIYPKQWDSSTKRWRTPAGPVASLKNGLRALLGFPPHPPGPSIDDLVKFTHSHLAIVPMEKSSMRRIEFTYKDKAVALAFLANLVRETDGSIRDEVRATASSYVAYLNQALENERSTEVRAGLAQLIVEQQRRLMMISSNQPFAEEIIDGPFVSSRPTSPQPGLAVALALVAGILICALIFVRRAVQRARDQ